jgi:hypothetical protein
MKEHERADKKTKQKEIEKQKNQKIKNNKK